MEDEGDLPQKVGDDGLVEELNVTDLARRTRVLRAFLLPLCRINSAILTTASRL